MSKFCKTLFWSLTMLLIASTSAYAKVSSCPPPATISFDNASYKFHTLKYGWDSESKPRDVANLGKLALEKATLTIGPTGDIANCLYKAANKEEVLFTKSTKTLSVQSQSKVSSSEIIPIPAHDRNVWNNSKTQNVFECTPSSHQVCAFDDLTPLPEDPYGLYKANDDLAAALTTLENELQTFLDSPQGARCDSRGQSVLDAMRPVWAAEDAIQQGENELNAARLNGQIAEVRFLQMQDALVKIPLRTSKKVVDDALEIVNKVISLCLS